ADGEEPRHGAQPGVGAIDVLPGANGKHLMETQVAEAFRVRLDGVEDRHRGRVGYPDDHVRAVTQMSEHRVGGALFRREAGGDRHRVRHPHGSVAHNPPKPPPQPPAGPAACAIRDFTPVPHHADGRLLAERPAARSLAYGIAAGLSRRTRCSASRPSWSWWWRSSAWWWWQSSAWWSTWSRSRARSCT